MELYFLYFFDNEKNPKNLISADKNIMDNYKKGMHSAWVPYKKCFKKNEEESKDNFEEKNSEDSEKDDDDNEKSSD